MNPETFCGHCGEVVKPGTGNLIPHIAEAGPEERFYHVECSIRLVIGGANHLLSQCTCCGGTLDPDPAGLSKRDAARAAFAIYKALNCRVAPFPTKQCPAPGPRLDKG